MQPNFAGFDSMCSGLHDVGGRDQDSTRLSWIFVVVGTGVVLVNLLVGDSGGGIGL